MHHINRWTLVAVFTIAISSSAQAQSVLSVRADQWCPHNCEAGKQPEGYMVDILRKIFEPTTKIDFQNLPWARAIEETREGKHGAIIGAFKEDAPDFTFPKIEFGQVQNCFFKNQDNTFFFKNPKDLEGRKIGIIKDYAYPGVDESIQKSPDRFEIVAGSDAEEKNIQKLKAGRIDAYLEEKMLMSHKMKLDPNLKFIQAGCLPKNKIYIAFSPKRPESKQLAKRFDEGMAKLTRSGELKKIMSSY